MYIMKTHNFPLISLWSANFKCVKWCKSFWVHRCLVFKIWKLNTRDIIAILKDTLNIISGLLPIPDPHAIGVPSNTLERHSISSRVGDNVHNLVTSFSMAKLVGFLTSDSTFTYQMELRTPHLWSFYLAKALWITILYTKSFTHFWRWSLVRELPSPLELPLLTILNQQSKWEDIHPEWYFLIHVPNQWFLESNSPRKWACSTPYYGNLCGKFALLVGA
jgi:hypothetical protein